MIGLEKIQSRKSEGDRGVANFGENFRGRITTDEIFDADGMFGAFDVNTTAGCHLIKMAKCNEQNMMKYASDEYIFYPKLGVHGKVGVGMIIVFLIIVTYSLFNRFVKELQIFFLLG